MRLVDDLFVANVKNIEIVAKLGTHSAIGVACCTLAGEMVRATNSGDALVGTAHGEQPTGLVLRFMR